MWNCGIFLLFYVLLLLHDIRTSNKTQKRAVLESQRECRDCLRLERSPIVIFLNNFFMPFIVVSQAATALPRTPQDNGGKMKFSGFLRVSNFIGSRDLKSSSMYVELERIDGRDPDIEQQPTASEQWSASISLVVEFWGNCETSRKIKRYSMFKIFCFCTVWYLNGVWKRAEHFWEENKNKCEKIPWMLQLYLDISSVVVNLI